MEPIIVHLSNNFSNPCIVHVGGSANPSIHNTSLKSRRNFSISNSSWVVSQIFLHDSECGHSRTSQSQILVCTRNHYICRVFLNSHSDEAFTNKTNKVYILSSADFLHNGYHIGIRSEQNFSIFKTSCIIRQICSS